MLTKKCLVCGKEFIRRKEGKGFCSRRCNLIKNGSSGRFKKGHSFTPKGHKRWDHQNVKKNWFNNDSVPWNKDKKGVIKQESIIALKEWIKKNGSGMKGKKHSEETKILIREKRRLQKNPSGEHHWNWKGGTSPLRKSIQALGIYRKWRKDCYERDDYTCKFCGQRGGRLNMDHIKPFYKIIEEYQIKTVEQAKECKELWEISNGRTLCIPCHKQTPSYLVNQYNK